MNALHQIKVLDILDDLGIPYQSAGRHNVRIKCLNPNHVEKVPSMFIHKDLGIYFCFSCGIKGSIFSLLKIKGIENGNIKPYLKKFITGGNTDEEVYNYLNSFITSRLTSTGKEDIKEVTLPASELIENHPYLEKRGLTKKEICDWNMSIVTEHKFHDWILIPIIQGGILRNYFMRSTYNNGKIYGEYSRSDILVGLDTASDLNKKIYVVEGIFDMIFFRRTRNQCVAALSNRLLNEQQDILKKYKEVVVVPDNDERGNELVKSAYQMIHNTKISVCKLPPHRKDAAECTLEELLEATFKEKSVHEYFIGT